MVSNIIYRFGFSKHIFMFRRGTQKETRMTENLDKTHIKRMVFVKVLYTLKILVHGNNIQNI